MIRPVTRDEAAECVRRYHSHHKPHRRQILGIGIELEGELVACVVVERPKAQALCNGRTLEVTRLAIGDRAPHCAASTLLGRAWRAMAAMGVARGISYTRVDEVGTCYRAAGWCPVALVDPETWEGSHGQRSLPGLFDPSTEVVARVRWEIGPDMAATRVYRDADGTWRLARAGTGSAPSVDASGSASRETGV